MGLMAAALTRTRICEGPHDGLGWSLLKLMFPQKFLRAAFITADYYSSFMFLIVIIIVYHLMDTIEEIHDFGNYWLRNLDPLEFFIFQKFLATFENMDLRNLNLAIN